MALGFSTFEFFPPFLFFSLLKIVFAAMIGLVVGLLGVGRVIEAANFYHGAARCSGRKFGSEFFTHLLKHFCAYFRLH